jgi:hypothetical protein
MLQAAQDLIGQMFKQSDPADFLHAALDYCHDRAPHKLEWLLELMQGTAYDREWVDRRAFPNCQVRCSAVSMACASIKDFLLEVMRQNFMYALQVQMLGAAASFSVCAYRLQRGTSRSRHS